MCRPGQRVDRSTATTRGGPGNPLKQPITFIYRNVVFCDGVDDAWAVYRLPMQAYAGLSVADKRQLLSRLAALTRGLEADFSLLRVSRPWDVEHYVLGVLTATDVRHVQREPLNRYLGAQRDELSGRSSHVPELYLSVRLEGGRTLSPRTFRSLPPLRALRRKRSVGNRPVVSRQRLESVVAEAEDMRQRMREHFEAHPAATHELQWLIRRAFTRGLGDPILDERFLPQALMVDVPTGSGEPGYRPLEADVLRLFDSAINVEARQLRIESERGESHQAFLCLGSLPEAAEFPGPQAELLFAPLESLAFPVDAAFTARFVRNSESARLVRRGIVDANGIDGDGTPSDLTALAGKRPREFRELEERLRGTDHPPLLQATVSLAVGAPTAAELEHRVELLRDAYESVILHRPLGEQLGLFVTHLPGQRMPVPDYDDYLTTEQFGAMLPIATNSVGADTGPCIGFGLTGARQPVLLDLAGGSRLPGPRAALLAGSPGAGTRECLELIMYQAFLTGSVVYDIDPRGDHSLAALPGVADELEVIEMSADERHRGLLDPLVIAPAQMREDLACDFLMSLLPEPSAPAWESELRLAIRKVLASEDWCCCVEVLEELRHGSAQARALARALTVHSADGIAALGFADPGAGARQTSSRQVTSLRIRDLAPLPPDLASYELAREERLRRALLRLLAVHALWLASRDRSRHAMLAVDEAWPLLCDGPRSLLMDHISRVSVARNVTPVLATRMYEGIDQLEPVIGTAFCFATETEQGARSVLRLLHRDEDDSDMRRQLLSFGHRQCLMRDHQGRVSPIEIDALDTEPLTPPHDTPPRGETRTPHVAGRTRGEAAVYDLDRLRGANPKSRYPRTTQPLDVKGDTHA